MMPIPNTSRGAASVAVLLVICCGLATAAVLVGAPGDTDTADTTEPLTTELFEDGEPTAAGELAHAHGSSLALPPETDPANVTEDEYVEAVPEEGDPYFEAQSAEWISYVNPRDEYRNPYLGDGSGKVCVTLVNEAGEVVVGESIPGTTVMIPTGESLSWHTGADPMVVEFPLTETYDRPLDADQFGTTPDLQQGDGYLDSHCIEWHGLPEDETVEYGEATVDGEYADDVEVVGYIQQAHEAWDTDVDPLADAVSYEEAGGGWTYVTEASHGQAVVVLQLQGDEDDDNTDTDQDTTAPRDDSGGAYEAAAGDDDPDDGSGGFDPTSGFGVAAALVALLVGSLSVLVRSRVSGRTG